MYESSVGSRLKRSLKELINTSFITVMNPHMKNNEVNPANAKR